MSVRGSVPAFHATGKGPSVVRPKNDAPQPTEHDSPIAIHKFRRTFDQLRIFPSGVAPQRKSVVGNSDDLFEREADRQADRLTNLHVERPARSGVRASLASLPTPHGGGRPLGTGARSFFDGSFDYD